MSDVYQLITSEEAQKILRTWVSMIMQAINGDVAIIELLPPV